jgi:hypothetical protein
MIRVGVENLEDLFALRIADVKAMEREIDEEYLSELKKRIARVIEEDNALHVRNLKVSGEDVMEVLNIRPGPRVGKVLTFLLERVLDDPSLNNRDTLLRMIESYKG